MKTWFTRALMALLVMGVYAESVSATIITWQNASTPINSAADIINVGAAATNVTFETDAWPSGTTLTFAPAGAINFGPAATVNGVSFTGETGSGPFWPSTGDTELDKILQYQYAFGTPTDPWTIVITGLSSNTQYMIQMIGIHDDRTVVDINLKQYNYQDTGGGLASPTLTRGTGGSVIGAFTTAADQTSLTINANVVLGNDPGVSAIVLRVVPEPASLALMGIGGLFMLRRRR